MKIVNEGHITINKMTGSWAGAMGHCQFIPSSFINYATDWDKDGSETYGHLNQMFLPQQQII